MRWLIKLLSLTIVVGGLTPLSACKNTNSSPTNHKPTPPPIDPDDNNNDHNNGEDENPHDIVVIHQEINGYDQEKEALTNFLKQVTFNNAFEQDWNRSSKTTAVKSLPTLLYNWIFYNYDVQNINVGAETVNLTSFIEQIKPTVNITSNGTDKEYSFTNLNDWKYNSKYHTIDNIRLQFKLPDNEVYVFDRTISVMFLEEDWGYVANMIDVGYRNNLIQYFKTNPNYWQIWITEWKTNTPTTQQIQVKLFSILKNFSRPSVMKNNPYFIDPLLYHYGVYKYGPNDHDQEEPSDEDIAGQFARSYKTTYEFFNDPWNLDDFFPTIEQDYQAIYFSYEANFSCEIKSFASTTSFFFNIQFSAIINKK
ncbi:hypothetical protein [Spiroplasma sp. DGKH1]|uniref:hypothetical protein n=1 Tax=Spiroplasma sp. DGKH1 TaxID=3050074 RepID=UPI0034C6500E